MHQQQQSTWVILESTSTHIPSFVTVARTELLIFAFLLLANQNKYAHELFNMRIQWLQTTSVSLVPTTTHTPSSMKIGHCILAKDYLLLTSNLHTDSQLSPLFPTTKQIISSATTSREKSFSGVVVLGLGRFSFLMVGWIDTLFWFLDLYQFQKGAIEVD